MTNTTAVLLAPLFDVLAGLAWCLLALAIMVPVGTALLARHQRGRTCSVLRRVS